MDPGERGEGFVLKGLPPSRVRPHFREAAVECTPPMAVLARAPAGVRGPHKSVSERGADNITIDTDREPLQ